MTGRPPTGGRRRVVVHRHGETTHNAAGIWQGQLDAPLSELGLRQADAVGRAIAALSPDRVVSSDLGRARLTAESVGRACGIPVELDPRFREIHAGAWQGLTSDEVTDGWPAEREAIRRGVDVRRGGDGESMADVLARIAEGLEEALTALAPGGCLVVSTHGGSGRAAVSWLLGIDLELAWRVLAGLGNCQWAELREGDAGWRIQTWNASSAVASQDGSPPP